MKKIAAGLLCCVIVIAGCRGEERVGDKGQKSEKKEEPQGGVIDPAKGTLLRTVGEPSVEFDNTKYDDAEWHYGGEFPEGTPISHGFTHIGFFLTWVVDSGLESDFIREQSLRELEATRGRRVSPIALLENWDGKLVADMLSDEGNAFATVYYDTSPSDAGYIVDFFAVFREEGLYQVAPTWENYDRIKPVINRRYEAWKAARK